MRAAAPAAGCGGISAGQLARLRELLGPVLERNRFYRRKLDAAGLGNGGDVGTAADYARLPFTTKDELSVDQTAHPPYGTNLTFDRDRYTRLHLTSGTTGERLRWLDTAESWGLVGPLLGGGVRRRRGAARRPHLLRLLVRALHRLLERLGRGPPPRVAGDTGRRHELRAAD